MGNISVGVVGSVNVPVTPAKPRVEQELSTVDALNVNVSDSAGHYKISAEAQYLFEMQKYFYTLDTPEQERALEYFTNNNNTLDNKVAAIFRKLQAFMQNPIPIVQNDEALFKAQNLLNTGFILDGTTEIGVYPTGIDVFSFEGKENYSPSTGKGNSSGLIAQLDDLEKASNGLLRNRDSANLFGAIKVALVYSEHVFLSADDVLHYQYSIEKAQKTIEFVQPPEHLKIVLNEVLNQAIAWQDGKQNKAIENDRQFIGNSRIGELAENNVRMGTAAQAFHHQLFSELKSTNNSILNAGFQIRRAMVEQPDLIRFTPDKIDEALNYYRADSVLYQKALTREGALPEVKKNHAIHEHDQKVFETSKNYALKVIDEIQGYVKGRSA